MYNIDDNLVSKTFISKSKILERVTELQIFALVFGFEPKENDYVTSPFRKDNSPNCWFKFYTTSNKLKFVDFASQTYIGNKLMINMDCFDCVSVYYKLSFKKTLEYIYNILIKGKKLPLISQKPLLKIFQDKKESYVYINITPRSFNSLDKKFWSAYGITSSQLKEDKVFPISKYELLTSYKIGKTTIRARQVTYAYTDFPDSKLKVYSPYSKVKHGKFITNCTPNEVGGLNSLKPYSRVTVITSSYKDYRVLKNCGLNVVWFQSEKMIPSKEVLKIIINRCDYVYIFYDNDNAGIQGAVNLMNTINGMIPSKASYFNLPVELKEQNITDPSDYRKKFGQKKLLEFLKTKII